MAKIVLLSLYDRNAYGLRLMSASLRAHGHECHLVFLKRYSSVASFDLELQVGEYPWIGVNKSGRAFKYASNSPITEREYDLLKTTIDRIQPHAIGMTVNTPLRTQSAAVSGFLKRHFRVPLIWGGYDPTVNPDACLEHCDYACVGEGDAAILEIAERADRGLSFEGVSNLVYRGRGLLRKTPKAPLNPDIDSYPWRDDDPEGKWFIEDDRLDENYAVVNDKEPGVYQAMSARGCPYRCSYCCEATFQDEYSEEKFLRRRSPENFVEELARAKRRFNLRSLWFEDEIFAMNLKWLERFAPLYKEKVDLPFIAYIYPTRQSRKILTLLREVGLQDCCLALESGSERINKEVFNRVYSRSLYLETASICRELGISFYTDIITYNPYETEQDLKETLAVLLEIGCGYDMCVNKLFVLPGTGLANKMLHDGLSFEQSDERVRMFDYYVRLFWIASFGPAAKRVISLIQAMPQLRRNPRLLNPALLEPLVSPVRWVLSDDRAWGKAPAVQSLRKWSERAARPASAAPQPRRSDPLCH